MEKTVRVGMIGAGFAAGFFAQSFYLVQNAELYGVTSLVLEQSQAFAEKHGIPHVFADSESLLNCGEIDAVYIATLPSDHKACMIQALNKGKHVICEKPFCMTAEDAKEVFALANEKNLLCMEAMRGNFLPMTICVDEMVRNGEIGEIKTVITQMGFRMNPMDGKNRVFVPEMGGGSLYEVGCYCINSILGVLGDAPKNLHIVNRMSDEYGVDLGSTIVMEYENGATGIAVSSIDSNLPCMMTICGTKGHIRIPMFHFAQSCEIYRNENYFPVFPQNAVETKNMPYESSNEQYEAQAFVDAILAGRTECEDMTQARSIAILNTIEACLGEK